MSLPVPLTRPQWEGSHRQRRLEVFAGTVASETQQPKNVCVKSKKGKSVIEIMTIFICEYITYWKKTS